MRKILSLLSFFFLTPSFILFSLFYLLFLADFSSGHKATSSLFETKPQSVAFAALPNTENLLQVSVNAEDGRVEAVRNFFLKYNSILSNYASEIVMAADHYNVPYNLLPAIAMQESGGCQIIPINSFNCYGYGIYKGHVTRFGSYEEGIDTVTHALAKHYINKGLVSPEQIMTVWDPVSSGGWSHGVNFFLGQL